MENKVKNLESNKKDLEHELQNDQHKYEKILNNFNDKINEQNII
jgi:hypothetical protein